MTFFKALNDEQIQVYEQQFFQKREDSSFYMAMVIHGKLLCERHCQLL